MISDVGRHNFLLSSNKVFIFSTHLESTGPSKIIHFFSGLSIYAAHDLIIIDRTPSDHVLVSASNNPYN